MDKTDILKFIEIPKIFDEGYLSFAEGKRHLPFSIKRFYLIYDVVSNAIRGKHAHKKNLQVLFCIRGSIKIVLDNGKKREEVILNQPNMGVFLDKMMWHEMVDFGKGTVLLVVASEYYKESDYIRNYETFLKTVKKVSTQENKEKGTITSSQMFKSI